MPFYEPCLDEIVKRNLAANRLTFTTDLGEYIQGSEVVFIAVGTPPGEDGSADLKYVLNVAEEIGTTMSDYLVVVTKSTVPVTTGQKVNEVIQKALAKRNSNLSFSVASNPEFLKEGAAVEDFLKPDRIVIGVEDDRAETVIRRLYKPFQLNGDRMIFMDIPSAEMTKYAANAMLVTENATLVTENATLIKENARLETLSNTYLRTYTNMTIELLKLEEKLAKLEGRCW